MADQVKILEAIAENLGLSPGDINRNALLTEDLNLGPLEIADLVQYLTEKFEIHFNPEDLDGVRTVDDLVILVEDSLI